MTAPVVNGLRQLCPDLSITLAADLPRSWLESRFEGAFDLISGPVDFGMRMASATRVLRVESAAAYRDLHGRLTGVVEDEARRLAALRPDLILANVPYVTLLGARRAGIPAVALSCLNWADIYGAYCGERPEAAAILADMRGAYQSARAFLAAEPAMPMSWLANRRAIGPLAKQGSRAPGHLRHLAGIPESCRVGVIAFGGMAAGFPVTRWPRLDGWRWIVTEDHKGRHDMIERESIAMGFTDILTSADVVVGKPGYATMAEAGVNGFAYLCFERDDWPETAGLLTWLKAHSRCLETTPDEAFDPARLAGLLDRLLALPERPPAQPTGAAEAAEYLASLLR